MKKLGHCTLCEKQVFDMPEPGRVGAPLDGARRVWAEKSRRFMEGY